MRKSMLWFTEIFVCLIILFLASCRNTGNEEKKKPASEDMLVNVNRYLVNKDADQIRGYVRRHGWNMNVSETGLWFKIDHTGSGDSAKSGKLAAIRYQTFLLDGTPCYSSDSLGIKKFRIGKGGIERGLEEGILRMRQGDKAVFIMPPHLAFGLSGDDDKIPPRSIIVCHVELVQISD